MVLYRKYRPQKLADLVGQEHIKKTIASQLATGKISHAYLFAGPKGTGKTTVARILAKAVNCEHLASGQSVSSSKSTNYLLNANQLNSKFGEPCNQCFSCLAILRDQHLDVIEIDAASNRGIDDVRNLRESIKLLPISARFKVYIFDETHMLTPEAFNALLKTLEEPPEHAIFILATTAAEKVPATILSRCQVFNFFPATAAQILASLKKIARAEGRNLADDILTQIGLKAQGSYRDAVVLLEKVLTQNDDIDSGSLSELLAGVDFAKLAQLAEKLAAKNAKEAILQINNLVAEGVSVQAILAEFVEFLRNLLFVQVGIEDESKISANNFKILQKLANNFTQSEILELIKLFEQASATKNSPVAQLPAELAIVQFCLKE